MGLLPQGLLPSIWPSVECNRAAGTPSVSHRLQQRLLQLAPYTNTMQQAPCLCITRIPASLLLQHHLFKKTHYSPNKLASTTCA